MNRVFVAAAIAMIPAVHVALPHPALGVVARQLAFDDMVRQSAVIVQGRVLAVEGFRSGGSGMVGRSEGEKESAAPAAPPSGELVQPPLPQSPPVSVGTRGGRMIFTRVTMEPTASIKGAAGKSLQFVVAGGTVDGRTAIVPGMPRFEVNETYVVFLRPGFQNAGDPIVGVNQGFFRVIEDPQSGLQVMMSANGDYVLGIENDRVVTRHNPQRRGIGPQPAGPPTADRPEVRARMSTDVERYWYSTEPLMTLGEFVNAVRSRIRR